jgi:hypothetical protein
MILSTIVKYCARPLRYRRADPLTMAGGATVRAVERIDAVRQEGRRSLTPLH